MNGCAPSLALMERLMWTWKWAIDFCDVNLSPWNPRNLKLKFTKAQKAINKVKIETDWKNSDA